MFNVTVFFSAVHAAKINIVFLVAQEKSYHWEHKVELVFQPLVFMAIRLNASVKGSWTPEKR